MKCLILLIMISFNISAEEYETYIPSNKESERFKGKCYKPVSSHGGIAQVSKVKEYKDGDIQLYNYEERRNILFLVQDVPLKYKDGSVKWEFNGVAKVKYKEFSYDYYKVECPIL